MIVGIFIIIWTSVASFIIGLLPDYHLPAEAFFAFHYTMASLSVWADVLPVVPFLTVIGAILTFEITIFTIRLFLGAVALVRGSGKPDV